MQRFSIQFLFLVAAGLFGGCTSSGSLGGYWGELEPSRSGFMTPADYVESAEFYLAGHFPFIDSAAYHRVGPQRRRGATRWRWLERQPDVQLTYTRQMDEAQLGRGRVKMEVIRLDMDRAGKVVKVLREVRDIPWKSVRR